MKAKNDVYDGFDGKKKELDSISLVETDKGINRRGWNLTWADGRSTEVG